MNPKVQKYLEGLGAFLYPLIIDKILEYLTSSTPLDYKRLLAFSVISLLMYLRSHPVIQEDRVSLKGLNDK